MISRSQFERQLARRGNDRLYLGQQKFPSLLGSLRTELLASTRLGCGHVDSQSLTIEE
jgi:hypothetical protein